MYGNDILQALDNFRQGARATAAANGGPSAAEQTLALIQQGHNFEEVARIRERQLSTIVATVAVFIEAGRLELRPEWVSPGAREHIEAASEEVGVERLADIKAK